MIDHINILYSVFLYRFSFLFLVLLVGAILNYTYLINLKKSFQCQKSGRKYQRIRDYEKRKKNCLHRAILGLIGIVFAFLLWVLPPLLDARNSTVIQTEATYCRENVDRRTGIPNLGGSIWISSEKGSMSVELYPGFSELSFPEGEYRAIVWYGENSRILLDISLLPSNNADEN